MAQNNGTQNEGGGEHQREGIERAGIIAHEHAQEIKGLLDQVKKRIEARKPDIAYLRSFLESARDQLTARLIKGFGEEITQLEERLEQVEREAGQARTRLGDVLIRQVGNLRDSLPSADEVAAREAVEAFKKKEIDRQSRAKVSDVLSKEEKETRSSQLISERRSADTIEEELKSRLMDKWDVALSKERSELHEFGEMSRSSVFDQLDRESLGKDINKLMRLLKKIEEAGGIHNTDERRTEVETYIHHYALLKVKVHDTTRELMSSKGGRMSDYVLPAIDKEEDLSDNIGNRAKQDGPIVLRKGVARSPREVREQERRAGFAVSNIERRAAIEEQWRKGVELKFKAFESLLQNLPDSEAGEIRERIAEFREEMQKDGVSMHRIDEQVEELHEEIAVMLEEERRRRKEQKEKEKGTQPVDDILELTDEDIVDHEEPTPTPSPEAPETYDRGSHQVIFPPEYMGKPAEVPDELQEIYLRTKFGTVNGRSDYGGPNSKYNKANEDSMFADADHDRLIVGVVDGAGGSGNGLQASRVGSEQLLKALQEGQTMESAFEQADREVTKIPKGRSPATGKLEQAYATAIVAHITQEGKTTLGWRGDAKAMTIRNGNKLSEGTTRLQNFAWEMNEGTEDERLFYTHPYRSVITGTIGETGGKERKPTGILEFQAHNRDQIVLASDGLWDVVSEYEVIELAKLHRGRALQKALYQLVYDRYNSGKNFTIMHAPGEPVSMEYNKGDNITIEVVEIEGIGEKKGEEDDAARADTVPPPVEDERQRKEQEEQRLAVELLEILKEGDSETFGAVQKVTIVDKEIEGGFEIEGSELFVMRRMLYG